MLCTEIVDKKLKNNYYQVVSCSRDIKALKFSLKCLKYHGLNALYRKCTKLQRKTKKIVKTKKVNCTAAVAETLKHSSSDSNAKKIVWSECFEQKLWRKNLEIITTKL
jgi:hypothetical protein